jgi:prepilin-type N-terminal cleavage/methylation domain-containing protein
MMRRIDHRVQTHAFTLLELMVVLALMALTVGVTTVGMAGASDEARLLSAFDRIFASHHLARCEAAYSGRPRLLQIEATSVTVRKPIIEEGRFVWSTPPGISVGSGVRVLKVALSNSRTRYKTAGPWSLVVSPGSDVAAYSLTIELGTRLRASSLLGAEAYNVSFEKVNDEGNP